MFNAFYFPQFKSFILRLVPFHQLAKGLWSFRRFYRNVLAVNHNQTELLSELLFDMLTTCTSYFVLCIYVSDQQMYAENSSQLNNINLSA